MKLLVIGDVHAKLEDLDECRDLLVHCRDIADREGVDRIVLLGDQNHYHSLVRVECMQFWQEWLGKLGEVAPVILMVGNHDQAANGNGQTHSMLVYRDLPNVWVTDQPRTDDDSILYLPYLGNQELFREACSEHGSQKLVFCHETFDGSRYENGFYAKDGINPNLVPQQQIVSGHIHSAQQFDKVWYVGSPRWQTMSDANQDRAVWVLKVEDGIIVDRKGYDTSGWCSPIVHVVDTQTNPVDLSLVPANARLTIDITGTADFIKTRKIELAGDNRKLRTFRTDDKHVKIKESDGVQVAFRKFIDSYVPSGASPAELLKQELKDLYDVAVQD